MLRGPVRDAAPQWIVGPILSALQRAMVPVEAQHRPRGGAAGACADSEVHARYP
jgi:hypothetical protein